MSLEWDWKHIIITIGKERHKRFIEQGYIHSFSIEIEHPPPIKYCHTPEETAKYIEKILKELII